MSAITNQTVAADRCRPIDIAGNDEHGSADLCGKTGCDQGATRLASLDNDDRCYVM